MQGNIFGINCQDRELWSVDLTLPSCEVPQEDQAQGISSGKMNSKVLVAVFTTVQSVVCDKVLDYSGGQAGYSGNAAQDGFNALEEASACETNENY